MQLFGGFTTDGFLALVYKDFTLISFLRGFVIFCGFSTDGVHQLKNLPAFLVQRGLVAFCGFLMNGFV